MENGSSYTTRRNPLCLRPIKAQIPKAIALAPSRKSLYGAPGGSFFGIRVNNRGFQGFHQAATFWPARKRRTEAK
jgi:hypothetical protein